MGCFLTVSKKDIEQLRQSKRIVRDTGWKTVPSDRRYEERVILYRSGRITRMTRVVGQPVDKEGYPHNTEFYASDGKKDHYSDGKKDHSNDSPLWDGHFSQSKDGPRHGTHKTVQALLDDLGISLKSE